jgi:hypothetical protein
VQDESSWERPRAAPAVKLPTDGPSATGMPTTYYYHKASDHVAWAMPEDAEGCVAHIDRLANIAERHKCQK